MLPHNFNLNDYPDYVKIPAIGTAVVISEVISTPLERIKIALQTQLLAKKASFLYLGELREEYKHRKTAEGTKSLYKGLRLSIDRQLVLSTTRFYTYYYTMDHLFKNRTHEFVLPHVLASCIIGTTLGTFFSQPSEISKLRMQVTGKEKGNNNLDSIVKMRKVLQYKKQTGVLLPGLGMNIFVQNMYAIPELLTFFNVKNLIRDYNLVQSNYSMNAMAAVGASTVASFIAAPLDLVYTRSVFKTLNGKRRSPKRIAGLILKRQGISGLYKSFLPTLLRISVFNVSMVTLLEAVCSSYHQETKFEGQPTQTAAA